MLFLLLSFSSQEASAWNSGKTNQSTRVSEATFSSAAKSVWPQYYRGRRVPVGCLSFQPRASSPRYLWPLWCWPKPNGVVVALPFHLPSLDFCTVPKSHLHHSQKGLWQLQGVTSNGLKWTVKLFKKHCVSWSSSHGHACPNSSQKYFPDLSSDKVKKTGQRQ